MPMASHMPKRCKCCWFSSLVQLFTSVVCFFLRPYHAENTDSHPITEVKQHQAWSVLGWVTAWGIPGAVSIKKTRLIGLVGRVFTNGLGDLVSIPGCVMPKTFKMVLDISLLNTQQYKVCIKGKVEKSRERSSTLPYTLVLLLLKREPSGHPRLRLPAYLLASMLLLSRKHSP